MQLNARQKARASVHVFVGCPLVFSAIPFNCLWCACFHSLTRMFTGKTLMTLLSFFGTSDFNRIFLKVLNLSLILGGF